MTYAYEDVDRAERARYKLALEADRDDLKHARTTLENAVRDIAFLIEDAQSAEDLELAAEQLREASVQVRKLAVTWNHIVSELAEL